MWPKIMLPLDNGGTCVHVSNFCGSGVGWMCEVGITKAEIQNLCTKKLIPIIKPKKTASRKRDAVINQVSWFK